MDTKQLSSNVALAVAVLYGVALALRRGTRYEAERLEWVLVALSLIGMAVMLPVFFAAI